jgi:hypothetical protein
MAALPRIDGKTRVKVMSNNIKGKVAVINRERTKMRFAAASALSLSLVVFAPVKAEEAKTPPSNATIQVIRSGAQPSGKGSADYFTGPVRLDPLFRAQHPSFVSGGLVTLSPVRAPLGTDILWARSSS